MNLCENTINNFLIELKKNLQIHKDQIFTANIIDIQNAKKINKENSFIERLTISEKVFQSMLSSLDSIISQPFSLGKTIKEWKVPHNGLHIKRIACPIGKILIIYESRPNVTLDAFALCFKSGNSCILRGGSESFETSNTIVKIIHQTFDKLNLSQVKNHFVQYLQNKDRTALLELLQKNEEIDLIIPRGSKSLIEFILNNTKIPILKHLDGNCHTYIEQTAIPEKAIEVLHNAKLRRVSVCGATESLVIDKNFAEKHLTNILNKLDGCKFFGCDESVLMDSRIKPATDEDFYTEYLSATISIKVVNSIEEAIIFINKHSSHHTDCILSENTNAVKLFEEKIDSAIITHNVSTQFADGYEFGFGGEIGISTGKLHARGPVALNELLTYKNIISGDGKYLIRP